MPSQKTRAWIYRIVTAAIGLLIVLGLLAEDVAAELLLLAAAILGIGEGALATANTSTTPNVDLKDRLGDA